MLTLLQAYSQIVEWAKLNFWWSQGGFLPPLTQEEVSQISSAFPFTLPKEVQDIYKLNNGQYEYDELPPNPTDTIGSCNELFIFDNKRFLPLEHSITRYFCNFSPTWVTLFSLEEENYLVLDVSNGHLIELNINCSEADEGYLVYISLTSMMQTHAEFYSSGGTVEGVMSFTEDFQKVWLKYNSEIGDKAIKRVLGIRDWWDDSWQNLNDPYS